MPRFPNGHFCSSFCFVILLLFYFYLYVWLLFVCSLLLNAIAYAKESLKVWHEKDVSVPVYIIRSCLLFLTTVMQLIEYLLSWTTNVIVLVPNFRLEEGSLKCALFIAQCQMWYDDYFPIRTLIFHILYHTLIWAIEVKTNYHKEK